MEEKRKVSTDALETLGTLIDENAKRDAIHLAVEPCIAGERLLAGQRIGIVNGKGSKKADKILGIVDPFIEDGVVLKGERFWLIVLPRTITSLRHVWSHPEFPENTSELTPEPLDEKALSQKWIDNFADQIRQHPVSLMKAADNWVEYEDYTYDNTEAYKDHWEAFPEFWKHYEVVTGKKPKDPSSFFTCSC